MKRRFACVIVFAFLAAPLLNAQFGGLAGRAKSKIDRATEKAKPVTGRAERALDTFQPWSAEEEQQIGEAAAARMISIFDLAEDPDLLRYVNLVGRAVAQFAPRQLPYRFGVLNTDIVAAFALPGGFVFVTQGALQHMGNEAQLAGVLGHEIVHVAERHLEREIRSRATSKWVAEEARGMTGDFLQERADALVKDLFDMRLSRDKEDHADRDGVLLASKAGYAAGGLVEFLRTLAEASSKEENRRAFGQLMSTHPPFQDRVERLEQLAETKAGGQTVEARFDAVVSENGP